MKKIVIYIVLLTGFIPFALAHTSKVKIWDDGKYRYIESNGIANHSTGHFPNAGNPNSIQEKSHHFRVPLSPRKSDQTISVGMDFFGVAMNGVPFDPATAEFWNNERGSNWNYDALSGKINLGMDSNNAHVQPDGTYHYHGIPKGFVAGKSYEFIGYAADGFPIYYNSKIDSSFRIKSGQRTGGPGGQYDGTFVSDYEYVSEKGQLDECNGMTLETTEYPEGTYAYFLTKSFPNIPRCFKASPDNSFKKKASGGISRPQRNSGTQESAMSNRREQRQPPQEALAACSGKSEYNSCSFMAPHGNLSGSCRIIQGNLACVPTGHPGPPR